MKTTADPSYRHVTLTLQGGTTKHEPGSILIGYTDGAVIHRPIKSDSWKRPGRATAWGYITLDGSWGMGYKARFGVELVPGVIDVAELSPVERMLRTHAPDGPALIRIDSQSAIRFLHRWQSGDMTLPRGYLAYAGSKARTLLVLSRRVRRLGDALTFEHVKAHQGDPFNDAAHRLAHIALNWGRSRIAKPIVRQQATAIRDEILELSVYTQGFDKGEPA